MKNPEKLRQCNSFVRPDVKIPNISTFFGFFIKKINRNLTIQESKTFKDFPKSFWIFGFLDFAENPKIQKSQRCSGKFWIFGFLDFSEICVSALCCLNFFFFLLKNKKQ